MPVTKGIGLERVARAAGVSTATVSNVLNRPHLVAESTQERVFDAMAALDFVPNRAASTLRSGFNRLLGVMVPELVNPFYSAITEAIADAAARHSYATAICVSHDESDLERKQLEMLAEQRVAGVLLVPRAASHAHLSQLRMVGARLVLIDRSIDDQGGCSVLMNDVEGARLATVHLLDSTRTNAISLVNGPTAIPQCEERRAGVFAEALRRGIGRENFVEFQCPDMSIREGVRIGRLIATSGAPKAVFCTNDQLAIGVIRGLRAAGLSVPADARVVGYGDLELAIEGEMPLTTIGQPKQLMGQLAVERVLSEIAEGTDHRHSVTVLEPTLIVRESAPSL